MHLAASVHLCFYAHMVEPFDLLSKWKLCAVGFMQLYLE